MYPEFKIFNVNAFMIQEGDFVTIKERFEGDNMTLATYFRYEVVKDGELSSSGSKFITVIFGKNEEVISTEIVNTWIPKSVIEYGETKYRAGYKVCENSIYLENI